MITEYFAKLISEDIYKHQQDQRVPHTYYLALSSADPLVDGKGIEPSPSAGYARAVVSNDELTFGEADSSGIVSNNVAIYFPESTSSWGEITHYMIFDAPTDGNLLMYGQLNSPIYISLKTMIKIPAGDLKISVENVGV